LKTKILIFVFSLSFTLSLFAQDKSLQNTYSNGGVKYAHPMKKSKTVKPKIQTNFQPEHVTFPHGNVPPDVPEQNYNNKPKASDIKILYKNQSKYHSQNKPVAYFVNRSFVGANVILNPNDIKSIRVEKEAFEKNGKTYFGKILITTKPDSHPEFISIRKLTSLTYDKSPILFQIDENVIDQDYNDYFVDKNFILKIEINKIKTTENKIKINLIKIITKTKDNIKKANEIRIRGNKFNTGY